MAALLQLELEAKKEESREDARKQSSAMEKARVGEVSNTVSQLNGKYNK